MWLVRTTGWGQGIGEPRAEACDNHCSCGVYRQVQMRPDGKSAVAHKESD